MKYQIYLMHDEEGKTLEGCWGSEYCVFDTEEEAQQGVEHLASIYPDCEWIFDEV